MRPQKPPAGVPDGAPVWHKRKLDSKYWRGQVLPRRPKLLRDRNVPISLLAGALLLSAVIWAPGVGAQKIANLANLQATLAGVAFAASLTGSVLALSILPVGQRRRWAERGLEGEKFSHYSELIFVFTWSGTAHLLALLYGVCAYIVGGDGLIKPAHPVSFHSLFVLIGGALSAYAILQVFSVLHTVSAIGVVIINDSLNE